MILSVKFGGGYTGNAYVYDNWYVIHGAKTVNLAPYETIWYDFMDIEKIQAIDVFTWSKPIESFDQLKEAVEYE